MYKWRIVFGSPKDYVLKKWIFDFKIYGKLTQYIRFCGILIQRYKTMPESCGQV